MIPSFLSSVFFAIGLLAVVFGTGYIGMSIAESIEAGIKRRREREEKLLAALKRLEETLNRLNP